MAPRAPASSGSGARTAGWIIGGAGVALLGAASYFGLRAVSDHRTAKIKCPLSPCSDIEGVNANDASRDEAELATAGFALGAATVGIAAYLLLTTSPARASFRETTSEKARVRWEPRVTAHGVGATLSADW